jgi:hypothetical protein
LSETATFCLKTVPFCLKTVIFCLKTVTFCLKTLSLSENSHSVWKLSHSVWKMNTPNKKNCQSEIQQLVPYLFLSHTFKYMTFIETNKSLFKKKLKHRIILFFSPFLKICV